MNNQSKLFKSLAKRIVENTYHDEDSNTLFVTNPGISFDVLKGLAKKHNFAIGQVESGEYISIPLAYKYDPSHTEDFSLYDDFMNTYTYYNKNYKTLLAAYSTLDLMEENLSEVALILDTYVGEVLAQGFVDDPLNIKISNQRAQQLIERVFYKNKIYEKLPNLTKSIAKYGNVFMTLSYPYLENWLVQADTDDSEIDFSRIDILEDLVINYVNPKHVEITCDEYYNPINYKTHDEDAYMNKTANSRSSYKIWQPWQIVHGLIPDELTAPYGKSMLWSMRSAFDQLTTLEALLGISRASNIQRLVFWIPMPNGVNMVDSAGFINEFRSQYLNSIFTDYGSAKSGRKMPGAYSILTLPMAADGTKVEMDHVEAHVDLSSVEDVEYFLDKILRNSSLPKGYLVGEDTITTAQTLETQDLKLRRTLIPLKKAVVTFIMNLIENILTHAGYDVSKIDVEVSLNEPIQIPADTIAKYNDIAELLGVFRELNPEMPVINQYQFLIKMGMPQDVASLALSKTAINALDTPDVLAKFLLNQKTKEPGMLPPPDEMEGVGEAVAYKLTSKQYLKENYELGKQLKEFNDTMRTSLDKSLKESLLISKRKYTEGEE